MYIVILKDKICYINNPIQAMNTIFAHNGIMIWYSEDDSGWIYTDMDTVPFIISQKD